MCMVIRRMAIGVKQRLYVDGIEPVMTATIVTVHVNFTLLGNYGVCLCLADLQQGIGTAFTRAGATEADGLRIE